MELDEQKLLLNIRNADTDDLLDRITAYRAGMEPKAVEMIESELHRRGVKASDIAEHAETCQEKCLFFPDGIAKMCSFCRKPAVSERWGWHRLLRTIPLFPRWLRYCPAHEPKRKPANE